MQSFFQSGPWFCTSRLCAAGGEGASRQGCSGLRKSPNPVILKEINRNEDRNAMGGYRMSQRKFHGRFRPVGARRPTVVPYSPAGTGCPVVERAIQGLYRAQNEESFWTLMSALNYALEINTYVLVPVQTALTVHNAPAPGRSIRSRRNAPAACRFGSCAAKKAATGCRCSPPAAPPPQTAAPLPVR